MQYRSMSFGAPTIHPSTIEKLNPKIKKADAKKLSDDTLDFFYFLMVNEYNSRGGKFTVLCLSAILRGSVGLDNSEFTMENVGAKNIFEVDFVLIPFHLFVGKSKQGHWIFLILHNTFEKSTLYFLDPLGGRYPEEEQKLKQLFEEIGIREGTERGDDLEILQVSSTNFPKQQNDFDCGVFVLAYAEAFLRDPELFIRDVCLGSPNTTSWSAEEFKSAALRNRLIESLKRLQDGQASEKGLVDSMGGFIIPEDFVFCFPKFPV